MFVFESFERTIEAMIHPDRRADASDRFAHRAFIASQLAVSAAALAAAPAFLAARGAPSAALAATFAFLMLPMAGALIASREGSLKRAGLVQLVGLFGASVTLAGSGAAPAALIWLAVAPFDAAALFGRKGAAIAACLAALAAVGVVAISPGASVSLGALAAFLAPAMLYLGLQSAWRSRGEAANAQAGAAAQSRWRLLAEAGGDLVAACDRGGSVLFSLQRGRAFGLSQRDLAGRGLFERVHVADRPAFLTAVSRAAATGEASDCGLRLKLGDADGAPRFGWAQVSCRPCHDVEAAVIVTARDVGDERARDDEIATMREEAERAGQWRRHFLATAGHELRTPLNAIIGYSELLGGDAGATPERRADYAGVINEAGQHLLSMVNSLLDMSKIEAGRYVLTPESVAMPALVDNVVEMVRLRAEKGGVALTATVDPRAAKIVADRDACRQILTNLLCNAIKFTGEGGSVRLDVRADGECVLLDVRDTGMGIRAADLQHIGDAFFQAGQSRDRAPTFDAGQDDDRGNDGAGLGLSLVRGLVGLHGGAIAIESAPNMGTTVFVRLPFDCRTAASSEPVAIHAFPRAEAQSFRPGAASALDAPLRRSA